MNHLKIDLDKCIGCGKCARMCMKNNIVVENKKAREVGNDCLECSHCVSSCPKGAIELIPRAKEDETFFSSIKKDKMFDGSMINDSDLQSLYLAMGHGKKEKYEFFTLSGDQLNALMDAVWDIVKDKESQLPIVKEWARWRADKTMLQPNPVLWEGQQVLFIFTANTENALIASQRMVAKGLELRIRGFHSNIIMTAYKIDKMRMLSFFPPTDKEMQMAYVIGHPRRMVEPVFKPISKMKDLFRGF